MLIAPNFFFFFFGVVCCVGGDRLLRTRAAILFGASSGHLQNGLKAYLSFFPLYPVWVEFSTLELFLFVRVQNNLRRCTWRAQSAALRADVCVCAWVNVCARATSGSLCLTRTLKDVFCHEPTGGNSNFMSVVEPVFLENKQIKLYAVVSFIQKQS